MKKSFLDEGRLEMKTALKCRMFHKEGSGMGIANMSEYL